MSEENTKEISQTNNEAAGDQIRKQLSSTDIRLASTDIEVDVSNAIKLPFEQISALGVALGSLPEAFRKITTTFDVPTLLQPTTKEGMPLNPSILNKTESGLIGSYFDTENKLAQARFQIVNPETIKSVATIPYDPTSLFIAAALSQINQKLDAIQDTVNEMFEYMKQKDKAELRGNIQVLESTLEAYRDNWNNDIWRNTAHTKVEDIKQESEKAIIHLRSQIRTKLAEKGPIEIRINVDNRLNEILDRLKEYQLAVYTYSFASFLEPMLCENYSESNLTNIASKISDHGIEYRELYTNCYDAIETNAQESIDAVALNGVASALSGLGSLIKQTPIGQFTPIDEALEDAGKGVGGFNSEQTQALMEKLALAKAPNISPFRESIEAVNNLHNKPQQIIADKDNIYLLPLEEQNTNEQ